MSWKAIFANFKQTFSCFETVCALRQSGTLLMWAQFCLRLKAESKRRFKKIFDDVSLHYYF